MEIHIVRNIKKHLLIINADIAVVLLYSFALGLIIFAIHAIVRLGN